MAAPPLRRCPPVELRRLARANEPDQLGAPNEPKPNPSGARPGFRMEAAGLAPPVERAEVRAFAGPRRWDQASGFAEGVEAPGVDVRHRLVVSRHDLSPSAANALQALRHLSAQVYGTLSPL